MRILVSSFAGTVRTVTADGIFAAMIRHIDAQLNLRTVRKDSFLARLADATFENNVV